MPNVIVNDEYLSDIADAIRSKLGVQTTYKPSQMASAIMSIGDGTEQPPTPIDPSEPSTDDPSEPTPTPSREQVPQTGTWQFKTTHPNGFLIIGRDDDNPDEAKFVRMVNGYGYPVVLNTESMNIDKTISSDADSETIPYPENSVSTFPNGTTIKELTQYVHDNDLGEIAQHDASNKSLWDSSLLDNEMDEFYTTYTNGGGTKTKEELKSAIIDKYKDTDVNQGATRVVEQRDIMESELGFPIYTIGTWGGNPNIVIDDITVGTMLNIRRDYNRLARQSGYFACSSLAQYNINKGSLPFKITRQSSQLTASDFDYICNALYEDKWCAELFTHMLVNTEDWQAFKLGLDKVKEYTDSGKIQVITRKQLADLGEYVEHPIVSLSIVADQSEYVIGTTLTESNFVCKATLDDGTEVVCGADRILDLTDIDTTTSGLYTIKLYYRGHQVFKNISIVGSTIILPQYVQDQTNGYYQTFRFADNEDRVYCIYLSESTNGFNGSPVTYAGAWLWKITTNNKAMKIFMSNNSGETWSEIFSGNAPANLKSNTATWFGEYTFGASQQLTLGDVVHITQ